MLTENSTVKQKKKESSYCESKIDFLEKNLKSLKERANNMIPKKRIYRLAEKQALQNWRKAYDDLQKEPKNMHLRQKEKLALDEYIAVQRAKADLEREGK